MLAQPCGITSSQSDRGWPQIHHPFSEPHASLLLLTHQQPFTITSHLRGRCFHSIDNYLLSTYYVPEVF